MSGLPAEVLHDIFFCLELKERLECLRVCRRWWKALDSYNLYHSFIIRREEQFNRVMDAFERLPAYATQVEELAIQGLVKPSLDERNLLKTFPNARVILVNRQLFSPAFSSRHLKTHNGIVHSKSKLEYLCDESYCTLATQMLSLNLGARLETLELLFENRQGSVNLFSQLKDLPVLKRLCLSSPHIKIDEIEDIHCNIPSIQDLSLNSGTHLAGSVPSNVVPATRITTFEFKAMRHADAETCAQMYQYMIKKYPNINKMDYYDGGLKDYDASERRYVYFNGILDFLKMIGPAQSRLFLQALTDDVNAFEALDAGHSQVEELFLYDCESETMLAYLGQSKQSESIRSIHMLDTIIKNLQPLKDMSALTALHIGYDEVYEERVDLVECLRACPPKLRSLTIHDGEVFVLPFNQQLESIESLELGMVFIDTDLGNIISNCLPNLIDLDLSGTLVCNVDITLKNPRRVHFHMGDMDGYSDTKYGFSFKCPNLTEPQYYSCCFDRAKQVERGDIKGLPLLSVDCLTVKKCGEANNGIYID